MAVIYNTDSYPFTEMLDGATMIGSLPGDHPTNANGTVQFTISGIIEYITKGLDFVHFQNASKAGQTIMGNDPDFPETSAPGINDGNKFLATIKNYPPASNADVNFIVRLRP